MAINYSLMTRSTNPADKSAKWLVYASAQSNETVTTRDIADHLAGHGSPFSVGTIVGLLQDAQKCIMEHLERGDRVDLGDLGAFFTTLASHGAPSAEEFTPALIKSVNLRWRPSKKMVQRIQHVELREVATRARQRSVRQTMKDDLNKEMENS